jgi:arginase
VLGVPSSAAAHWPGQERAPAVLREGGLISGMAGRGWQIDDRGDLPLVRCRPDSRQPQNLELTIEVGSAVRDQLSSYTPRRRLLVLGGDCTITLGVIAGLQRSEPDIGLFYLDGGPDLRTPADQSEGCLDAMGVAHLLGLPGTESALVGISDRRPALRSDQIVFVGGEPDLVERQHGHVLAGRLWDTATTSADPVGAASAACERLTTGGAAFLIHLDVDVVEFTELPLADYPRIHSGLSLSATMRVLATAWQHPLCRGVILTELNPDHGSTDGSDVHRWIGELLQALTPTGREGAT